ncbi:hypothetical protein ACVIGA_008363 [Bradyrhizobium sp. USDA 3240]
MTLSNDLDRMGDRPPGRPQSDVRRGDANRYGVGGAQHLTANWLPSRIWGVTGKNPCAIEPPMITVATSYFWYFSYDSSLAAGGSRSI